MTKIIVTERAEKAKNVIYLSKTLREVFNQTDSIFSFDEKGGRSTVEITVSDFYEKLVKDEVFDKIADVIAVNYKYQFFKQKIIINGLEEVEKELLFASLISADIEEDKKYIIEKLKPFSEVAIDGIYNFKLKLLKQKWQEIVSYIPSYFNKEQLKDFITYLLEGKKKKVYVDTGIVYDVKFRRLKRGDLMDESFLDGKVIREIILSGCGQVELFGGLSKTDEFYLKEYYGDKVYMSKNY